MNGLTFRLKQVTFEHLTQLYEYPPYNPDLALDDLFSLRQKNNIVCHLKSKIPNDEFVNK